MMRINLLPHREMRREKRKREFTLSAAMCAVFGAGVVFAGGMVIDQLISNQNDRNTLVATANKKLDAEIAEIKDLKEQINALKARQKAVEDLQSDRTIPVHLFDELVRLMPEGVFLQKLSQQGMHVTMAGYAQSNERVAELYQNLADRSDWLQKPQLLETKEVALKEDAPSSGPKGTQEVRRVYEFNLNVAIKNSAQPANDPGRPGGAAATVAAAGVKQ
jgi:type IV pilus assembly protein PilN